MPCRLSRLSNTRVVLTAIIVMVLALYFLFDPMESAWMPKCPLKVLTGLSCPGCGSQRAVHALLHADFRAAAGANLIFVVLLPVLAVMAAAELFPRRWPKLRKSLGHTGVAVAAAIILTGWAVVRNILGI